MKQVLLFILIQLTSSIAFPQNRAARNNTNYEAANWKLWHLDNPDQIVIAAPPGVQESKRELATIKQCLTKLDSKKIADIRYWDAGAPSYRWNQLANKVLPWDNIDIVIRMPLSWMNLAVYDATIIAWKEKMKYKRQRPTVNDPSIQSIVPAPGTYSYPCEHAVTAAAAAYVLAYFIPAKADSILSLARQAAQSRIDAGVQFPSDVEAGWKLGEEVAKRIIAKAKNDGSVNTYKGEVNKDPKKWTGKYALGINVPLMAPLVIKAVDQFRPPAPPDFAAEMKEMKEYKQNFRSRSLAYFWANSGPELWTELAAQKMFENRISDDAPTAARIFAVLNVASHDVVIATFDAKYAYWGIRPSQYDTTYKPLLMTPPFPGYPSGHAAGAGTSAAVLTYFFPADEKQFNQLARDCADSRFYAGIHFKTDNETALAMGKVIGKYVAEAWVSR